MSRKFETKEVHHSTVCKSEPAADNGTDLSEDRTKTSMKSTNSTGSSGGSASPLDKVEVSAAPADESAKLVLDTTATAETKTAAPTEERLSCLRCAVRCSSPTSLHDQPARSSSTLSQEKKKKKQATAMIMTPTPDDILMGRGRPYQKHAGNEKMRRLVEKNKSRYSSVHRDQRGAIANELLDQILQTGARFLKRRDKQFAGARGADNTNSKNKDESIDAGWEQASRSEAYEKMCHALRAKNRPTATQRHTAAVSNNATQQNQQHYQHQEQTRHSVRSLNTTALLHAGNNHNRNNLDAIIPDAQSSVSMTAAAAAQRRLNSNVSMGGPLSSVFSGPLGQASALPAGLALGAGTSRLHPGLHMAQQGAVAAANQLAGLTPDLLLSAQQQYHLEAIQMLRMADAASAAATASSSPYYGLGMPAVGPAGGGVSPGLSGNLLWQQEQQQRQMNAYLLAAGSGTTTSGVTGLDPAILLAMQQQERSSWNTRNNNQRE